MSRINSLFPYNLLCWKLMYSDSLEIIKVELPVTWQPPRRSLRAIFPHKALQYCSLRTTALFNSHMLWFGGGELWNVSAFCRTLPSYSSFADFACLATSGLSLLPDDNTDLASRSCHTHRNNSSVLEAFAVVWWVFQLFQACIVLSWSSFGWMQWPLATSSLTFSWLLTVCLFYSGPIEIQTRERWRRCLFPLQTG